jgi:hypothetical protein
MSQKTNPVSLRLQNSNKHFESCWYSDIFYDQVLDDEIQLRTYMESVLYQAGRSKALPSVQTQYRRSCTFIFFLDTRGERHKREYSLKLSREPVQHVISPKIKYLTGKSKPSTNVWDGLFFNQPENNLYRESLSQEAGYNRSLEYDKKKDQDKLRVDHNTQQGYLCNQSIKGSLSYLELLPLISPVRSSNVEPSNVYNSNVYNTIINPEVKHNFNFSRNDFPTKVKRFLSVSITSLALARSMLFREESSMEVRALALSVKQTLDTIMTQLELTLDATSKTQNAASSKNKVGMVSNKNVFPVQSESRTHENSFRRLIIDGSSQSIQNRFSYLSAIRLRTPATHINSDLMINDKIIMGSKAGLKKTRGFVRLNSSMLSSDLFLKRVHKQVSVTPIRQIKEKSELSFTSATSIVKKDLKVNTACIAERQWHKHTELFLNLCFGTFGFATLYPVRALSPLQSAGFLLESVSYLLQRKSSFRQIKDDIFRELDNSQIIKGMRLSCAGRLGGRSKKAQKAKTQSAQWGETSLTVFSSRLAFSSKGVSTAYGKVGVKIWLCYKS